MRGLRLTRRTAVMIGASSVSALATALAVAPAQRTLFVLGDSWAAGLHADPQRALGQVAAEALRWGVVVDAVSGTGYVNGADVERSYADRAEDIAAGIRADVVVVQGGSNDRAAPSDQLATAARFTLANLKDRLPSARQVMLGPGPDPEPVTPDQRAVDRVLTAVAAAEGIPYISMLQQHWIPRRAASAVLDPENHHPTIAGQAYLGRRLERSLRQLFPSLMVG